MKVFLCLVAALAFAGVSEAGRPGCFGGSCAGGFACGAATSCAAGSCAACATPAAVSTPGGAIVAPERNRAGLRAKAIRHGIFGRRR